MNQGMWFWLGIAYFAATSIWVFFWVARASRAMKTDVRKRELRLVCTKMIRAAGFWEFGVAWVIVVSPGMGWTNAIGPFGMGLLLILCSEFWLRVVGPGQL